MTEASLYDLLCHAWIVLAIVAGIILFRTPAPYGRHTWTNAGPEISGSLGWMSMESVSLAVFIVVFLAGPRRGELVPLTFGTWWVAHYAHRAFVQPIRQWDRRRAMPLFIVLAGAIFNVINASLNARWLTALGPARSSAWLGTPAFAGGAVLLVVGAAINVRSDETLLALRTGGGGEYGIPRGFLYRWLSCPNYLGEIIEWTGWAIATWSMAGVSFAVWTAANLVPRARAHHQWYRARLPGYPRERRALIPGVF